MESKIEKLPFGINGVDIHKIIDDSIEKSDRSVTIYISKDATTISIYPHTDEKHHWIRSPYRRDAHCSNCGHSDASWECSTFCPGCGEQMYGVKDE